MARGLNKVLLIGNVGKDPDIRTASSGEMVVRFPLATSETFTKNGERHSRTEWHNVVAFRQLAEVISQYVSKGRKLYIEGALRTSRYTATDGSERWATDIVANEILLLGGTSQDVSAQDVSAEHPQRSARPHPQRSSRPHPPPTRRPGPVQAAHHEEPPPPVYSGDAFADDDIPF